MSKDHVPEPSGRVHYPCRQGVEVTSRHFTALGKTYAITNLTEAGRSIGTLEGARRVMLLWLAAELPIVIAIVAATPTPIGAACAFVFFLFAAGMLWYGKHRWPTPLELWACHRGQLVLLFISSDYTEFGKIERALLRAMENCRPIGYRS